LNFLKKIKEKSKQKKAKKVYILVTDVFREGNIPDIRSIIPLFRSESDADAAFLGFDQAINEILYDNPDQHLLLIALFQFLIDSDKTELFQLFFESILFHPDLYLFLRDGYGYAEDDMFDGFLLQKAEQAPSLEAKQYTLAVLGMLDQSFLERKKLE
jgi:hypothetical protein